MEKHYDVVVVGGGNGGLTAAATMAKAGYKTLMIEKHNLPGGCATSFVRGRFEFEASLHELCLFGPKGSNAPVRRLFDELGCDIEWAQVPDLFRSISYDPNDYYDVRMPIGVDNFLNAMEKEVPGSYDSMKAVIDCAARLSKTHDYMYDHGYHSDGKEMMLNHREFLELSTLTTNEGLDRFGVPQKAKEIFNTYWDYIDADADTQTFSTYLVMFYAYLTEGAWIPKNRSHEISLAWDKAIRKWGGEIWYNTEVTRILVKDNKAYGVETPDCTVYADHIICNLMPRTAYGKLIDSDEVPERAKKMENARKIAGRPYCCFLGLNKSPEELGIEDYTIFVRNTGDTARQKRESAAIDTHCTQVINCLNIVLPNCSPKGTSMIMITKFYSSDDWSKLNEKNYYETKEKVARDCIKQYKEVVGVDISDCIEEVEISSPVTYARYLGTPQGTCYGYDVSKWDGMLNRILDEEKKDYTIQGLRFCGAAGALLDGYSQAYLNGNSIAKFTLNDMEEE